MELILTAMMCACLMMVMFNNSENRRADMIYEEAEQLVSSDEIIEPSIQPDNEEENEDDALEEISAGIDLSPLREANSDVTGWIEIPGVLSYPLMQGGDNAYYLSHAWNREDNSAGAIFLDYRSCYGYGSFNTIIYGHRMRNGTMFGRLKDYADPDFWLEHPSIFISDENGVWCYDIYAAYEVSVAGCAYQLEFANDAEKQAFVRYGLECSVIETGIVPTVEDEIITLSTCSGNGYSTRWVVQAVKAQ